MTVEEFLKNKMYKHVSDIYYQGSMSNIHELEEEYFYKEGEIEEVVDYDSVYGIDEPSGRLIYKRKKIFVVKDMTTVENNEEWKVIFYPFTDCRDLRATIPISKIYIRNKKLNREDQLKLANYPFYEPNEIIMKLIAIRKKVLKSKGEAK